MIPTAVDSRQLRTADDVITELCTVGGVGHDFRPMTYESSWNSQVRTSWVCVWCMGVACGNYTEVDPCFRIYHHRGEHVSRAGVTWPIGGPRPA